MFHFKNSIMSKKFTSFLILAVALLLSLPSQAQNSNSAITQKKKEVVSSATIKNPKKLTIQKNAKVAAQAAEAKAEEKKISPEEQQYLLDKAAKESDNTVGKPFATWNWEAHATPKFVSKSGLIKGDKLATATPFNGSQLQLYKTISLSVAEALKAKQANSGKRTAPKKVEADPDYATITLTAGDIWEDGSGYQLLLDKDATAYGTIIPETGGLTTSGDAAEGVYDEFEYKIPENADGSLTTSNIVINNSITIKIPEGTYDWVVTNPTPGDRVWIATDGRYDDYVFEKGHVYEFTVALNGNNDKLTVVIDGEEPAGPEVVTPPDGIEAVEYAMTFTNSSNSTESKPVNVAVDGNDVYFQGMSKYIPDAWVKGTKSDNIVTFEGNQYMGEYSGYESYFFYTGTTTFTYDPDADTYSATGQVFGVLGGQYYDGNYTDPVLNRVVETAATPANPAITNLQNGNYGYYITFNVPLEDTEGNPLVSSKLSYEIFTDIEHDVQPLTFTPATHSKLTEDMTIIPYGFTEGYDFYANQIYLNNLYSASWNKIGIKSIYTGGGETHETEVQWYDIKGYADDPHDAVTAPYTADFTTETPFGDFYTIDNNLDGSTWSWSETNYANYHWNSSNAADDYLILPIELEGGKSYNVIVEAAANSASWAEKFEVVAGTAGTVDALTTTVIAEKTVNHADFQEYEGTYTPETDGTYYIAIHATSDADMFYLKVKKFTVEVGAESGAPAAVENFTVVPFTDEIGAAISFNAPTKTIDGADLAAGDITKIEILRDGNVINTIENPAPGSEQIYSDDASDLTAGNHTYQVIPYGASGIGVKSEEITVLLTGILNVPYIQDMTVSGVLDIFQVIDNNNDGKTWTWSSSYGTYYGYSGSNAADDYLITLPIKLQAGKNYTIKVNAKGSSSYPEKFEVLVGSEPTVAGLNQTVIGETIANTGTFTDYESDFSVSSNGVYYIAIHAISDPDMLNLCVSKLSIEAGAEPTAPAAAELTGAPGAEGALEAILSFTAPATAVNGSALSGTEDIKIYRDDVLVNTLTGVATGSAQTWTDTDVEDGKTYVYYVVAANESGDGQKSNKVSVFVGQDTPADVTGFQKTADTATSLTFAWDEVTGVNGGYVNAAAAEYTVYSMAIESNGLFSYLVPEEALGSVTGATTATVDYGVDEGEQNFKYFGVSAKIGTNETDPTGAYTYALVGAPYELPIAEGFTGSSLHYVWDTSDNARLGVTDDTSDGDDAALALQAYGEAGEVTFFTGKVNLNPAANPTIIFDAKKGTSSVSALTIFVLSPDGTSTDVETVTLTDEYQSFKVSIPSSAKNGRYNQVGFKANFPAVQETVIIDNIKICDLYQYNLSVDLTAPKTVQAGNKVTVSATVKNLGEEIIESYNLTVKAGEKELFNQDIEEPLAMFESKKFDIDYETTIFDEAGDVTITAEVTPEVDLDETDNTSEAIITLKQSTAPAPRNVSASEEENGDITVTWDAPEVAQAPKASNGEAVTYDFEDGMGDWTTIDSDGDGYAWEHIDVSEYEITAHSGVGMMTSASFINNYGALTPDNWLISPKVELGGELSFYAWGRDPSYASEVFAVYVTTGDPTDLSGYTLVSDGDITATGEKLQYTFDLSAFSGEGYVAIRHYNVTDMFVLDLDDVTITPGASDIDGYNIYVDGELETSVDAEGNVRAIKGINKAASSLSVVLEGLAKTLTNDAHEFAVTAVYASGAESKPEVFVLTTTTNGIEAITVDGKPVDIYSIDGKLVRKQATSLEGLRGLYIINDKKVIIK